MVFLVEWGFAFAGAGALGVAVEFGFAEEVGAGALDDVEGAVRRRALRAAMPWRTALMPRVTLKSPTWSSAMSPGSEGSAYQSMSRGIFWTW